MVTREFKLKQKEEAIKRIKMLGLMKNPVQEFEKEGKVNVSHVLGLLYWLDDEEKEMVKNFERNYDALVYHVIKTNTTIGTMYSLFHVGKYTEDWEHDRESIKESYPFVYVVNKDVPEFSEYGCIGVRPCNGGLVRIS